MADVDAVTVTAQTVRGSFGVYVHVPYCTSRCGYCDFNTYLAGSADMVELGAQWAAGVAAEISAHRRAETLAIERPVDTVFFGGGTPSLLPVPAIATVLDALAETCGIEPGAEITIEANPESVSPRNLRDLLAVGVNRLSVGMQSDDPRVLDVLDRAHQAGAAQRAVALAMQAGFTRCSLDLIYGTPGETIESWRASLAAALATEVGHISAYALAIPRGTAMARRIAAGELPMPDDDDAATKYEIADELLGAAGLDWYEVSNWAAPGQECRHNLGYWRGGDWWGLGPGAHGHVRGVRYENHKLPDRWFRGTTDGTSVARSETLDPSQRHTEHVMLATRLREGLDPAMVPQSAVQSLVEQGLLIHDDRLRLTRRGRLLGDRVVLALLE
ncbi:MAG: coproporphyrinogen III oxidase [Actinobacteria bacterium]|nr:coproporphyrinogen III oxidase [Actinomycetota bacterium]